jgi:hypothetical protein
MEILWIALKSWDGNRAKMNADNPEIVADQMASM